MNRRRGREKGFKSRTIRKKLYGSKGAYFINRRFGRPALIGRQLSLKMHHFKQTYHPLAANVITDANCHYSFVGTGAVGSGTLYGPATGDVSPAGYFAMRFTLADLPQVASFAGLFDAYRINKVVVKFVPYVNSYTTSSGAAANLAAQNQFLSTVIDYDDASVLTTEGSLLEYETYKTTPAYRKHTRSLVPALSQEAFKTSGTTIGYTQQRKKWIDAAYTDVECYGIKGLINGPAIQADQVQCAWKVIVTAYVSFKQTR